jgi:hypothetical protein
VSVHSSNIDIDAMIEGYLTHSSSQPIDLVCGRHDETSGMLLAFCFRRQSFVIDEQAVVQILSL